MSDSRQGHRRRGKEPHLSLSLSPSRPAQGSSAASARPAPAASSSPLRKEPLFFPLRFPQGQAAGARARLSAPPPDPAPPFRLSFPQRDATANLERSGGHSGRLSFLGPLRPAAILPLRKKPPRGLPARRSCEAPSLPLAQCAAFPALPRLRRPGPLVGRPPRQLKKRPLEPRSPPPRLPSRPFAARDWLLRRPWKPKLGQAWLLGAACCSRGSGPL